LIDIENDVIEMVTKAVLEEYPEADVSGEYTELPASFPAVTVVEADNSILQRMRTENIENAAVVMYQVNVFSNKAAVRKEEAKAISNLIDEAFTSRGFTRIMRDQVPNLSNSRIYRIVARYAAVVGPDGDNHYLIYQYQY